MSDRAPINLNTVLTALKGQQATLSEQQILLTQVLSAVDRQEPRITEMRAALTERIDRQDARMTEMRVAVMERIDRLQDTVTEMRDDQTVLLGLLTANQKLSDRQPE